VGRINALSTGLKGGVQEGHKRSLFADKPNPLTVIFTHQGVSDGGTGMHHHMNQADAQKIAHGSEEDLIDYLNREKLIDTAKGRGHSTIHVHIKGQ
jgi:hypothetical protein